MVQVYFARHAQSNSQQHDDRTRELTQQGLRDRGLVTRYLADKGIGRVLSSPYRRAIDTIAPFAEGAGLPIEIVDEIRERVLPGGWIEDFDAYTRRQWQDFSYTLPGGESLAEVQRRNVRALLQALVDHRGGNIAIGSHGTALCTVIRWCDPSFGYEQFAAIQRLMPWVVRFSFVGARCVEWQAYDLFKMIPLGQGREERKW